MASPILPPTTTLRPVARRICPISAVVVDLPLVPVMPITFGRRFSGRSANAWANNSISPITGASTARASSTMWCGLGWVSGIPGDRIKAAMSPQSRRLRSSSVRPSAAARAREGSASSQHETVAPPASSAFAVAMPVRPNPNTATRRPSYAWIGIIETYPSAISGWRVQLMRGSPQ